MAAAVGVGHGILSLRCRWDPPGSSVPVQSLPSARPLLLTYSHCAYLEQDVAVAGLLLSFCHKNKASVCFLRTEEVWWAHTLMRANREHLLCAGPCSGGLRRVAHFVRPTGSWRCSYPPGRGGGRLLHRGARSFAPDPTAGTQKSQDLNLGHLSTTRLTLLSGKRKQLKRT